MEINPRNVLSSVPPPPPEVKVRTMRTDLESMAKSGGGLPQFQNVQIKGIAVETSVPRPAPVMQPPVAAGGSGSGASASGGSKSNIGGILAVIAVAILAIGAVAYFAYAELGHGNAPATSSSTQP